VEDAHIHIRDILGRIRDVLGTYIFLFSFFVFGCGRRASSPRTYKEEEDLFLFTRRRRIYLYSQGGGGFIRFHKEEEDLFVFRGYFRGNKDSAYVPNMSLICPSCVPHIFLICP